MEHLDLPPQRIPVQFLVRVRLTCDRQIGYQFPPDRLAAIRRAPLSGVDHSCGKLKDSPDGYQTREYIKTGMSEYVEVFYNNLRLDWFMVYKMPAALEQAT